MTNLLSSYFVYDQNTEYGGIPQSSTDRLVSTVFVNDVKFSGHSLSATLKLIATSGGTDPTFLFCNYNLFPDFYFVQYVNKLFFVVRQHAMACYFPKTSRVFEKKANCLFFSFIDDKFKPNNEKNETERNFV